jgi:methyl-accepting chemotaxis protein
MPKSLVARVRLIYLPLDVMFTILIPLALVNSLDASDTTYALLVLYGLGLLRSITINIMFGRLFGPIGQWIDSASALPDSREVREIDSMIRRAPGQVTTWIGGLWLAQLVIGTLVLLYINPYHAGIAPRSLVTAVLMGSATLLGTIPFTTPLMSVLLNDASRALFALSHKAGIRLHRDRTSLQLKLIFMMSCIGLAGPVWMASTSYTADAARASLEAKTRCAIAASDLARQVSAVAPGDTRALERLAHDASTHGFEVSITKLDGEVVTGDHQQSPPLAAWIGSPLSTTTETTASPHDAKVAARSIAGSGNGNGNGYVAVVVAPITEWASSSMIWPLLIFFGVVIGWGPMCAYLLARNVVTPLQDITRAVQQITEVGRLDEVVAITVSHNDETGALASRFNDLVETLRDLGSAAGALAKGDLEIRLAGEGDVAVAFRAMIESLGRIVRQIHETSVLLAAAATEIYAASQEQEAAAASQSTAMVEIRQTMESLFEAAAHVSESVRGVLSNAERTLETTDRMVIRIGDLTNHAGRIGEILETIRDISDRSDLLALNGALEASRAGEAGRGFGLVAGEMRRLAERVLSSVHDVRSLVGDIRASGSSTMMATEDSKKLAASTTDAARQITLVTQQQRSGTEQVLQSVREIAETLTQSVAAMAQTRASAEQLKSQADKLSTLVRAFRIETPQA